MTISSETPDMRVLDAATRQALVEEVDAAKERGWLQPDLRRWFKTQGVDLPTYLAAKAGQAVDNEAAATFAQISITGLPTHPYAPNPEDIRRHIEWLIAPARGAFDDALFEIAYDGEGRGPVSARLFGLDEIQDAVAFAVMRNIEGRNIYIGAALRAPDTDRRKRSTGDDFYVATAVPIDIDHDYDATRARMALVCDDGLVVTTGLTPERRSQHWARLIEPCDDDLAFEAAFGALVSHTGADMKVKDKARIMRLGGTVSFPKDQKKRDAGYCTELTSVSINSVARSVDVQALSELAPGEIRGERFDASGRPKSDGIERAGAFGTGPVTNGRESYFRNRLLAHLAAYQEENGADPSPEEVWELAWADFSDPTKVDNSDGRWTGVEGQRELRHRLENTFRRLRGGRLARFGLYSIETEINRAEAEAAKAARPHRQVDTPIEMPPSEDDDDPFEPCGFDGTVPPPRPWAWGSMLMYMAVTGIAAPPGVGKTTFSFQVAIAFAMDLKMGPWGPVAGGGGKAWLYNGEEPPDELSRRYLAACTEMGLQPDEVSKRVSYNSGLKKRLSLVKIDPASGEVVRSPDVDRIKTKIIAGDFKLFIIDPLIEFHDAKEDTQGLHAIGAVLREIAHDCNCAVLFFHHTPKTANSDTAAGDMNAMRGGGPIIGVARFVLTMFSMTVKDAEELQIPARDRVRYVRLDDAKANMALMSAEPQWWQKLGVCIENADDTRPADNIGVLRYANLRAADGPMGFEETMKRSREQEARLDRIAEEMARVCRLNGWTSQDKAVSLNDVVSGMSQEKSGYGPTTVRAHITGGIGAGREVDGGHIVISNSKRGEHVVRKVHLKVSADD